MIYPIYVYGSQVLRKIAEPISKDFPELEKLVSDMFETMDNADGIGLAAPQIGKAIRLFCVDLTSYEDELPEGTPLRQVFINADIYERFGDQDKFNEGCLSVPGVNEDVVRDTKIKIRYTDLTWTEHDKEFDGIMARVIQHEYDHIDGKLFVDHLSPIRKTLLKSKLLSMIKGKFSARYRCKVEK